MTATPPPDRARRDHGRPHHTPSSFSAYVVTAGDGDRVDAGIRVLDVDQLGTDGVTVQVDWSAVNYKDAMVTRPGNRVARISPLVPGVDLVGTVLTATTTSLEAGARGIVQGYGLGVDHHGGFAQLARVPAEWVVPLPAGITDRQAATIGTAGFTAALSLSRLEAAGLSAGQGPVLVTGASGGVGSMAVTLLAACGYEVVASTGKISERAYLEGLGASEVIDRDTLASAPERTLGPERWAGAVDCVGGSTLGAVLRTLRYGAAVAASGLTGGNAIETSVYPFIVRDNSLIGVDTVSTPIDERRRVWERMATAFPAGPLDDMVAGEVGLGELTPVLDRILAGAGRGRTLVVPNR